jgi:hypothetical protein
MIQHNRRQAKNESLIRVPTSIEPNSWWVINEGKSTLSLVSVLGSQFQCTCEGYKYRGDCKHIQMCIPYGKKEPLPLPPPVNFASLEKASGDMFKIFSEQTWQNRAEEAQGIVGRLAPEATPVLTPDQQDAFDSAIAWYMRKKGGVETEIFVLTGNPGSGKSYTIQEICKSIYRMDNPEIALCAPTHKAKHILAQMAKAAGLPNSVAISTVHSLLSLRPNGYDSEGNQLWRQVRERCNPVPWETFGLVVCDESSMLSEELLAYIPSYPPVIYIGDKNQLPPVGADFSPLFALPSKGKHLDKVVRYDGAILEFVNALAARMNEPQLPEWPQKGNISLIPTSSWEDKLIEEAQLYPGRSKALAWTNRRVVDINAMVRDTLFPNTEYTVGESLVAKEPVFIFRHKYFSCELNTIQANQSIFAKQDAHEVTESSQVMQTCEEAQILSIGEGTTSLPSFPTIPIQLWILTLKTELGLRVTLPVIAEESRLQISKQLNFEKNKILELEKEKRGKKWADFYQLLEKFNLVQKGSSFINRLQYAYALTVHQSQGSTFQKVFLDLPDILKCKDVEQRNKLIYVGASRAAKKLLVRRSIN